MDYCKSSTEKDDSKNRTLRSKKQFTEKLRCKACGCSPAHFKSMNKNIVKVCVEQFELVFQHCNPLVEQSRKMTTHLKNVWKLSQATAWVVGCKVSARYVIF